MSSIKFAFLATCAWQLVGCMVGDEGDENLSSTDEGPTFEEFRAQTYREPWEGGHYIVDTRVLEVICELDGTPGVELPIGLRMTVHLGR